MNGVTRCLLIAVICTVSGCKDEGGKAPRRDAERMYDRAMKKLNASDAPYTRWCWLDEAAMAALQTGKYEEARTFAEELRRIAPLYQSDWNYGNAVHVFNAVLGGLALESGDVASAKAHLIESGRTRGSPQLASFGPNMYLAKLLLEAGERAVVLEYLELCRVFWENDKGKLDQWKNKIKAGSIPDFGPNLFY